MTVSDYQSFVAGKLGTTKPTGISSGFDLPESLFPHQSTLTAWALRRGRAAIFADTGLGKSRMQVAWANAVQQHTRGYVLILAPLAVAAQTAQEGAELGVIVRHVRDGSEVTEPGIYITNYDRLHRFDCSVFEGVVLDESSCIKHHDTKTLKTLLAAFKQTQFKLCATATPAPNDWTELGTHAEFLGVCTQQEMLAEFFCHDGGETSVWRLKGHARHIFWRWVCQWGALVRKPSDLGFDDHAYNLPPMHLHEHTVETEMPLNGMLFAAEAQTLSERRESRKLSMADRVADCAALIFGKWGLNELEAGASAGANQKGRGKSRSARKEDRISSGECAERPGSEEGVSPRLLPGEQAQAKKEDAGGCEELPNGGSLPQDRKGARASLLELQHGIGQVQGLHGEATGGNRLPLEQWIIWCDLNAEQDALERLFGDLAFSIRGSNTPDEKCDYLAAWLAGERPVVISKPSILGWGINMQQCAHMAFVGVTDSFEAYYQAVRRCWRFGQKRDVHVHVFASEAEGAVVANLRRKERDAQAMAESLSAETHDAVMQAVTGSTRQTNTYNAGAPIQVPAWLRSAA